MRLATSASGGSCLHPVSPATGATSSFGTGTVTSAGGSSSSRRRRYAPKPLLDPDAAADESAAAPVAGEAHRERVSRVRAAVGERDPEARSPAFRREAG